MAEKIVIIGAGSLQFGLGTVGSILNSDILKGSTVCLHDIDEDSLNLIRTACESALKDRNLDYTIEATLDRQKALKNATFIINSIEIGPRFKWFDMDFRTPLYFGIKNTFGENGGPGGLFHSLRVIPPILEICEDISRICPKAFFINYSNPMSRICLAIKRKFPSIKFVGLCHELMGFMPYLTKILETPVSNLEFTAAGLNHFGVFLDIKYVDSGKDAYPDLRKKGPGFFKTLKGIDGYTLIAFILEKFGYCPYTPDSHFSEYIQWSWEIAGIAGMRNFIKWYEDYVTDQGNRLEKAIKRGKGSRLVKPDNERAIPIIEGMITDDNHVEPSVNIPNDDIITNLSSDLVVECPAHVTKDGMKGITIGEFPKGLAGLLRNQGSVQDLVAEAAIKNSKELALQALFVDPNIHSAVQAEKFLDYMLDLQKDVIQLE